MQWNIRRSPTIYDRYSYMRGMYSMSASNKKKLRKEQSADILSAKQQQEQAEAKKLKIYTISFLAILIVVACAAIGILSVRGVKNSGIIQRNTIAAQVGDRELNTVELSYYYIDAINKFYDESYNNYGENTDAFLSAMGLDTKKPLNEQAYDEETDKTWADFFIDQAITQAENDYAMYDLATAEGYTLSDEEKESYDSTINMLNTYATIYGYSNTDLYLRAVYGYGSTLDSYSEYYERSMIAASYYADYETRLTYTEEDRNTYAADKEANFNSYTYTSVYMSYTYFQQGGTADEDGHKTYSDEENAAARKAMEDAANALATATSVEDLKEKAKAIQVNEGSSVSATENTNVLYSSINATLGKWLAEEGRQAGDIAAIPNESTTTDADGNETTNVNGYYVVIYHSKTDNTTAMADMGYIYVPYEGGTEDEDSGEMVFSDEDKANTRTTVEGYLSQWESGEKTEASLEELANSLIEEEKASAGGLVENLHTDSEYDDAIMDWVLAAERTEGETTIVEADDGFYLLYYAGKSELNYRQYMIDNEMRAADFEAWYHGIVDAIETAVKDTSKMDLDMILTAE